MYDKFIVWFDEVDKDDVGIVGGKGANLGEMTSAGFPIPYGFIVTSYAYFYFLKHQGIDEQIKNILHGLNHHHPEMLQDVSQNIKELIIKTPVPARLAHKITHYYERIREREKKIGRRLEKIKQRLHSIYRPPLVAVRSSATAEDLPDASFAGQQETYLNVRGEAQLVEKVRECWASLFTERAIFYRAEKKFDHFKVGLASVVQRMVQSDTSGIVFTVDPMTRDKNRMVIEAVYGLGEYIVQGKVTPDQYLINKKEMRIESKKIGTQQVMLTGKGTHNIEKKLSKKKGAQQKISDKDILAVAEVCHRIEKHYYFPQDIEWAIEKGKLFITQSRPITTLDEKSGATETGKHVVYLSGDPASPGVVSGAVVIVSGIKDLGKVKAGDILVAQQTNPDFVPAMKRAAAIVTERGGRTSHAAIVSRELGIPCIVGVAAALKKLHIDDIITVNGSRGEIYKGAVTIVQKEEKHTRHKTRTKIYLNLAEPEKAKEYAQLPVDGIGLLRAEFMIANIGIHPKKLLQEKKGEVFINKLAHDITRICKAFYPRSVVYRATDFKTNEYRHLKGGERFEPKEANPMLGYRGAYRYISEPEVFALEVAAIKKVREHGYSNLHLMIPFVRSPFHLRKSREFVEKHGLTFDKKFKLWMMVELPVNVIQIEDFLREGVDGVSIGSNDLTMLLLGTDRDNETVANLFDERNEAVYWALRRTIQACHNAGVTSSICGQSVSDYQEILDVVIKSGITSVSVSPDAVWRVQDAIYQLEKHGSNH